MAGNTLDKEMLIKEELKDALVDIIYEDKEAVKAVEKLEKSVHKLEYVLSEIDKNIRMFREEVEYDDDCFTQRSVVKDIVDLLVERIENFKGIDLEETCKLIDAMMVSLDGREEMTVIVFEENGIKVPIYVSRNDLKDLNNFGAGVTFTIEEDTVILSRKAL